MAFGFSLGVALLLSVCLTVRCADIPDGFLHMECHDRYFMTAVDLSFAGDEPHFEAVDETGVHPITEHYGAKCGYSVSVLPLQGLLVLRASYFSCHTDNRDDEVFTFNFNLAVTREGNEVSTYSLNRTCSLALPWSPREVTCEANYMEVSVTSEVTCPSVTKRDDSNSLKLSHGSTTSDWQVMFQKGEDQLPPMHLSEAWKQGYVFDLTDGRFVFRTPYGQPDSSSTEVNGVPVEVVHATLFSRQSWVVLLVDLVAACSTYEGSYDSGYMVWETPDMLYPSLDSPRLNIGFNGELVEQLVAEERGYIVEKHNATVQISIPYNAEEAYRKSIVVGNLFEFYVFHLCLEQILVDEDHVETRLRFHRTLATPLLPYPVSTVSQTLPEEHMFTVYLGDIPEDVVLAAVHLNGQEYTVSFTNISSNNITEVVHPNDTHGYTLMVPFDDPVVLQKFSEEDSALQYTLDINFTLTVLPENEPYYHLASIVALFTDVSPPAFDAVCSESGISFKLDHRSFDYLWEISIGSDLLTSELAAQHGYIMSNDSQTLLLDVPLFAHGYEYENITLKGFFGTFEILVRDCETSEVQSSTVKTCPFTMTELIMCSTDGRMTVVADLSLAIPGGTSPARTNLIDDYCGPKEADDSRVLFSFPLNGCRSTVKLDLGYVTYQNEISYSKKFLNMSESVSDATERVRVQCTYPLAGLHRLFTLFRFESDTEGIGSIIHTAQPTSGLQSPTIKPPAPVKNTRVTRQQTGIPVYSQPAVHPTVRYIKVSSLLSKGVGGSEEAKEDAAKI